MNKSITIANYILAKNMQDVPVEYILDKVQELYPGRDLARSDVYNALRTIRNGYVGVQPAIVPPVAESTKRKRYTALQHGDYVDAASFVAKAVAGRFDKEQRGKFLQILTDKLA